jgi:hypothetical protein
LVDGSETAHHRHRNEKKVPHQTVIQEKKGRTSFWRWRGRGRGRGRRSRCQEGKMVGSGTKKRRRRKKKEKKKMFPPISKWKRRLLLPPHIMNF